MYLARRMRYAFVDRSKKPNPGVTQVNFIPMPMSSAERYSTSVEDLCVAMFLEGARVLGAKMNAPISLDDQAKILEAVNALGERLAFLLEFQCAAEPESELPN